MAFGLPPKHIKYFEINQTESKDAYVMSIEAAKKLNWNIGTKSASGFIAFTRFSMSSWSEEVQIQIENDKINISSESTSLQLMDWGKNKKNIETFISTYQTIKSQFSSEEIHLKYAELKSSFVPDEEDTIKYPRRSNKRKFNGFLSIFQATNGYYITPILLVLNILIYMIMVLLGVDFIAPDSDSLLLWGANYRSMTLDNQWWRLISSCFIHIGIFHLLMNMYALAYIGLLLEPYLGKSRFLSAYLLTGIAGSVASLYWHDLTISAGASGAIFGMYGVFLAMLTTNLIEKSSRNSILISILFFVGYNLLNGLKGGIDNAAHIGGLISGIVIGYVYFPSLKKPNLKLLKPALIGIVAVLILSSSYYILTNTSNDIGEYEKKIQQFTTLESRALEVYGKFETATKEEIVAEIQEKGIKSWKENITLLEDANKLKIPTMFLERNALLIEYCSLRLDSYDLLSKAFSENTDKYQTQLEEYNLQIEDVIGRLSSL